MNTNKLVLSRRLFNVGLASIGGILAIPFESTFAADGMPSAETHRVRLPNDATVAAIGQGAWHLGQGRHPPAVEEEAVRTGIASGMTLIDTSGNYGNGRSEQFLSRVIAQHRDGIFLVTKVEADEVSGDGIPRACEASLKRLGTDHIDLYLLHSPVPSGQLAGVVSEFEKLRTSGRIRAWGVSNFNANLMEALIQVPDGHRCATNQVPYSLKNRSIEREVLPWCMQHKMPVMAYSPLGGDNNLVVSDPLLSQLGAAHKCSAAAIALAWVIHNGNIIAIPESGSPAHAKENAAALSITLSAQEIQALAAAYPGPSTAA